MRIVAIDPGPHCGMAIRRDDGTALVQMIHNDIDTVLKTIIAERPEIVVVERFATGGRLSSYGHETIEIVGMMQGLAYAIGAKFLKQTPQQRHAFLDQSKTALKGKRTQHEIDAFAHLLAYEHFNGG